MPRALTYFVPSHLATPVVGARVLCPLGNREVTGVVVPGDRGAQASPSEGMRPLSEVLDDEALWSPDLVETVRLDRKSVV